MPTFTDSHPAASVPRYVLLAMVSEDRGRLTDEHGVRSLGHWAGDGSVHCVLQAPDAEAVRRYHADRQLRCEDLRLLPVNADNVTP